MSNTIEESVKYLYEELKPFIESGLLKREWEEFIKGENLGSAWYMSDFLEQIYFNISDTRDETFHTNSKKDMEKLAILIINDFNKPILDTHRINSSRDRILGSLSIALSVHNLVTEIAYVRGEIKDIGSGVRFGVLFKDNNEYVYGIGRNGLEYTELSLSHNLIMDLKNFIDEVFHRNI